MQTLCGRLKKMRAEHEQPVSYFLVFKDEDVGEIDLNSLLGKTLKFEHTGRIFCCHCDRLTRKSFSQGYCYPCFTRLAETDQCIMSPEKCHFDKGTCRDTEWAEANCMQKHVVYLSNTSGLKVGITRGTQVPTRWIDQGAIQAMPIATVSRRQLAGFVETSLKQHVSDRTQWQRMLKNETSEMDLAAKWKQLQKEAQQALQDLQNEHGESAIELHESMDSADFSYPVKNYPEKIKAHNFDKTPILEDVFVGIKGQYLIFENLVVNIRKYTSYEMCFSVSD